MSCQNIYKKYSIKGGTVGQKHRDGNFITYVIKVEWVFKDEKAVSLIRQRHMQKIR